MRLPSDWTAERASGWWELHHLTHESCGFRTGQAYDLICNESDVRRVVYGHTCDEEDA
jgi:hypothetical protein